MALNLQARFLQSMRLMEVQTIVPARPSLTVHPLPTSAHTTTGNGKDEARDLSKENILWCEKLWSGHIGCFLPVVQGRLQDRSRCSMSNLSLFPPHRGS